MTPRDPNSTSWRDVSVNIRMDPALRDQLVAEADRSVRSLSGEIVFRLRKSVELDAKRDDVSDANWQSLGHAAAKVVEKSRR
jgi:TraY domain